MKQLDIWKFVDENFRQRIPVMILYVLESNGSSPGRQGFFMSVNLNGDMEGSLGGGIMEHKFVEMAKTRLQQDTDEISVHKQIHDKLAPKHQSGMICSGEQTIVIYKIHETDAPHISAIINCLQQNKNGTLQLSPAGITFSEIIPTENFAYSVTDEKDWSYAEKIGYKNHLYIIGGGHCALALSQLMSTMDFYIHVYDEREHLNTMHRNVFAHEKHVIKNYASLAEFVPCGKDNYVVVMTFGYRSDYIAFWSLLNKKFKYVGLLGSKSKIDKMFADYMQEGVDPLALEAIHAPVGVNIRSHTPQEIAISIAAEIIKVKNEGT